MNMLIDLKYTKHTESEILIQNVRTLKNKQDINVVSITFTHCHTVFIRNKKNSDQVKFSEFS